jgi:hypothetical protein
MENTPLWIDLLFILCTLFSVWVFYLAAGYPKPFPLAMRSGFTAWAVVTTSLGRSGFYQDFEAFPPRMGFLIGPPLLTILLLFLFTGGRRFLDSLNLNQLLLLHVVRIPVELVLFFLFKAGVVPVLMTFEGWNYDILSGISALILYLLIRSGKSFSPRFLLIWNLVCLGLLLNIVTIAVLSLPTPFQQLAFDQPNIGVTQFPFVWLPGIVVPLVLVAHLAALRQLWKGNSAQPI